MAFDGLIDRCWGCGTDWVEVDVNGMGACCGGKADKPEPFDLKGIIHVTMTLMFVGAVLVSFVRWLA